jgi:hypothetical protein
MTTRLSNTIRGMLKTFGLLPGAMRGVSFDRRVESLLGDRAELASIVRPMLAAWRSLREQIKVFDKAILMIVRHNPTCRLLMSVPGIGALSVLAYVSTVEEPTRFARSRSVGAHLGLTPRRYQSGEVDRSGRISRCGDGLARTLMYEAAVVILTRVKRALWLKDWALAIAKRAGSGKARTALARKLAVILHSIQHLAFRTAVPLDRARRRLIVAWQVPSSLSREQIEPEVLSLGAKVQAIATEAVGPRFARASPLWTLQWLRFGPDAAAALADRAENHDPGGLNTDGSRGCGGGSAKFAGRGAQKPSDLRPNILSMPPCSTPSRPSLAVAAKRGQP